MSIPCSEGLLVFGHTFDFFRDYLGTHQRINAKHGDVVRVNAFFSKSVYVYSADANRTVLQDADGIFSARGGYVPLMSDFFAEGLLLKDAEDHKRNRRIMQKSFQREAMNNYIGLMSPLVKKQVEAWPANEKLKFYPSLKVLALDIASTVFIGSNNPAESKTLSRNFDTLLSGTSSIIRKEIPGLQFWRSKRSRKFMEDYFRGKVEARRNSNGNDLFSRLCQAQSDDGEQLDNEAIMNHMIFLLFAAHETTTTAVSTLMAELAGNPEWQERLRAECRAIGGRDHVLTYDDLEKMTQTEWCLDECMRLNPPVLTYVRRTKRDCVLEGQEIPARSFVIVTPAVVQHAAKWWKNPEKFDPERYAPGRAEHQQHPGCWIPFGLGPHTCLGMRFAYLEAKIILFALLQRYRVEFTRPDYRVRFRQIPTAIPADGLPLVFRPLPG